MLRRTGVECFNPKGLPGKLRPRNPGLNITHAPKTVSTRTILNKVNFPFDDQQSMHRELVSSFVTRFPTIMRGFYGRRSRNMGSMQRAGRWFTMKMSSYRWLRKQEQLMLRVSNITAAMQEHGMDFPTYRYKKVLHDLQLNNNMAAELARIEPLAFRAIAETLRSDNCIMYDRHPDYREAKAQITKSALGNYNKFALNNPLPTIRRSPDPTWRELPMYQGRQHNSKFHGEHPIFLTDWKI